jgi:hypothetical protein
MDIYEKRDAGKTKVAAGARMNVKFLVNVPDVSVDRRYGETQALGDFLIEVSASQQFEHVEPCGGRAQNNRQGKSRRDAVALSFGL